jgi:hypothetical protein
MELISGDVEGFHYGFAHLDAFLIAASVERALDRETGLFDDGNAIKWWCPDLRKGPSFCA